MELSQRIFSFTYMVPPRFYTTFCFDIYKAMMHKVRLSEVRCFENLIRMWVGFSLLPAVSVRALLSWEDP